MAINITTDEEAEVKVSFTSLSGNPARVDGAPLWSSSESSVATVMASADGMSAVVTSVDEGEAELVLKADADLGEGIEELMISTTVLVRAAKAGVAAFSEPAIRPKS